MSNGSHITVNVGAPRVTDALKRVSARSVVDGLAKRYRFGVQKRAAKLARASTRDAYAVSEGGTATVVASYPADGYDYNIVQKDGTCYVVKTPAGYSGKLDLGSVGLGEEGDIESIPEQNNADLLEGKSEDAVARQLKAINRRNRAAGGSADMSGQAADEMFQGEAGEGELSPEGDTTDARAAISMQSKSRRAWSRWSPSPRPGATVR